MKGLKYILSLLAIIMLAACSTTEKLPAGETLYTGVGVINYTDHGDKDVDSVTHETGVIIALADAGTKVYDAFTGKTPRKSLIQEEGKKPFNPKRWYESVTTEELAAEEKALEIVKPEVAAVLEYAPNNSLFGSAYHRTPFPIGLWAYNAWGQKEKGLGHWLYKTIGSEPILVSSVAPQTRIRMAQNVLRNYGYFHNEVKYTLTHSKRDSLKAKVNYYIHTGMVSRIDSVDFRGFSGFADSLIRKNIKNTYLKKGEPFSALTLTKEQSRISTLLRNQGYYYYQPSYATFKADTIAKPYKVQLRMQPSESIPKQLLHKWYIGNTYITILNSVGDTIQNELKLPNGGSYYYSGTKEPVRLGAIMRCILDKKGSLYRNFKQERSLERLTDMGIFSMVNLSYQRRDTLKTCDTLDLWVNAILDKRYTANLEVNVTERNNDRIGPGLSLGIDKRNVFRGAEQLSFELFGSYEWKTNREHGQKSGLLNSYEVGTKVSFEFPRIVFFGFHPERKEDAKGNKIIRNSSTSINFKTDWLNRSGFYNLFSLGFDLKYSWRQNRRSRHEFIPFSLTYDRLINTTTDFDSIMQASPALAVSMQNKFVPAIEYTYAYTQDTKKHRNPFSWTITVKEAGGFTSGIYAIAGQKISEKNKRLFRNPFAQFLKVTTELRNNFTISNNLKLVTRLMGGIAYSYGNSDVVPYSEQFYSGGANSIRAFPIRSVGPGRFVSRGSKYSYMDQTGDLKFEANAELRFPLVESISGALFLDAGNVWMLRKDEYREGGMFKLGKLGQDIALGTGAGIRYDMDFLVVRFDLGFALHDPASQRSGYFNTGKLSNRFAFHFAIGYPF